MKPVLTLFLATLALGCNTKPDEPKNDAGRDCDPALYPCGNFGYLTGSNIDNLKVVGRRDDDKNGTPTNDPVRDIWFADYYQNKDIKAFVLLTAAEWCQPCREEQPDLVALWDKVKGKKPGVAFLEAIVQDKNGAPADMVVVDRWANKYDLPFDVAADPADALGPYYDINAFPMQMVVSTCKMKIEWKNNGGGEAAMEDMAQVIDDAIAEPCN